MKSKKKSKKPPCNQYEPPTHVLYRRGNKKFCRKLTVCSRKLNKKSEKQLRTELNKKKLSTKGNKDELCKRLQEYYIKKKFGPDKLMVKTKDKIISELTKKKLPTNGTKKELVIRLHNNYINNNFDRSLCNNLNELYTLTDINDIEKQYFYTFLDSDNNYYCFDYRTLAEIINGTEEPTNPYNKNKIPIDVIWNIKNNKRYTDKLSVNNEMNNENKINLRIVDLFSEIDLLGFYTTSDIELFKKLSLYDIQFIYIFLFTKVKHQFDSNWDLNYEKLDLKSYFGDEELDDIFNYTCNELKLKTCNMIILIIKNNKNEYMGQLVEFITSFVHIVSRGIYLNTINGKILDRLYENIFTNFKELHKIKSLMLHKSIITLSVEEFTNLTSSDEKKQHFLLLYKSIQPNLKKRAHNGTRFFYNMLNVLFLE